MNAMTRMTALALASLVSLTCSGDGQSAEQKAPPPKEGASAMTLQVTSTAFKNGEPIPPRYTCTDRDISPPLAWAGAPSGTKSYALIGDDPDAPIGTWVHWVIFNLPADSLGLPEAVPTTPELPNGARQGRNSWKKIGYGGPCPPPGKPHRYFFKLYALDGTLPLDAQAGKKEVEAAMKGRVLAEGQLMGTYRR